MFNRQHAFNTVWKHFITEGNPQSINERYECLYNGPEGVHCAFAVLVPDSLKPLLTEGISVKTILEEIPVIAEELGNPSQDDVDFLRVLQGIHDTKYDGYEENMRVLALAYDLETPD